MEGASPCSRCSLSLDALRTLGKREVSLVGMLQERCANCGHAFSFHSKRTDAPCKAIGCHGGPNGWVCTGFVPAEGASQELLAAIEALSTPA